MGLPGSRCAAGRQAPPFQGSVDHAGTHPHRPVRSGLRNHPWRRGGRAALAEGAPALPPRVSWGAIAAGAIVAVMIGLMLNILGAAIGVTAVDAVEGDTPDASTFGIGAAIWLLVATLVGLGVGAYAAARLSGTADKTDATLHGVGVWAIGFLLSAVLLGNIAGGAASSASPPRPACSAARRRERVRRCPPSPSKRTRRPSWTAPAPPCPARPSRPA